MLFPHQAPNLTGDPGRVHEVRTDPFLAHAAIGPELRAEDRGEFGFHDLVEACFVLVVERIS